jgi:hypothetical protein
MTIPFRFFGSGFLRHIAAVHRIVFNAVDRHVHEARTSSIAVAFSRPLIAPRPSPFCGSDTVMQCMQDVAYRNDPRM